MGYDHLIDTEACRWDHGSLGMLLSPGQWFFFLLLGVFTSQAEPDRKWSQQERNLGPWDLMESILVSLRPLTVLALPVSRCRAEVENRREVLAWAALGLVS